MIKILKWSGLFVLVMSISLLIGYLLVIYGVIKLNNPSRIFYPIHGIDVSHHQGEIDWKKVNASKIDFAIIKATEGSNHKDTKFIENWNEAKKEGVIVGAYHYYSFCKQPFDQFQNFSSTVTKEKGMLPPAIDLEYDLNCNDAVPVKDLQEDLSFFIENLKVFYGVSPIIYCNEDFYEKYLQHPEFSDCIFWIRNTYRQPNLKNEIRWTFWQHSAKGKVEGIKGDVDMNVFNGRKFQFEELLIQ